MMDTYRQAAPSKRQYRSLEKKLRKWELIMTVSDSPLNRFERYLFRVAVVLAGLLILARIAAMVLLTFADHTR
jgi:hypothetical protein